MAENNEFLDNVALVAIAIGALVVIAVILVVIRRCKKEARKPDIECESFENADSEAAASKSDGSSPIPKEGRDVESDLSRSEADFPIEGLHSRASKLDLPRRFPSGCSSLETMRRPALTVENCDRSALNAAVRAELARWSPRDQASVDVVSTALDMMAKAGSGALIAIAPLAELQRLHMQSTDTGYLTKRLKDTSVFHPCFEKVFLEFASHSDNDCWAHDYHDAAARGLPKDGAILLSPTGSPAKCAVKVVGLPMAPSQWPGRGTRHETALGLAGHLQQGVVLVLSSSRILHCLLARDRGYLALQASWLDGSASEDLPFKSFKSEPEPELV